MKNKGSVLFGLLMIAFTSMAMAQDKAKQIDELMRRYVDNGQFNGTVLVTDHGKLVFKKGYGLANMEYSIPDPKEAIVEDKILDTYVGKYQLRSSFEISITKEGGSLYAQATNQPRHELFAESATKFFMKAVDDRILFVKNEQGSPEKLILFQNGQEMQGKRVN